MPTTTWATAIAAIAPEIGFVSFTTTTNITTNTSVISTQLAAKYNQDDYFNDWYVIIRGTGNDEVIRRVSDYTASSGTLTVAGANLASESASVTCELHRVDPLLLRTHWNQARIDLFPFVAIVRDSRALVTGQRQFLYTLPSTIRRGPLAVYLGNRDPAASHAQNLFTNAGFETWAAAVATGWTLTGTGSTQTQETQTTTPDNYAILHDQSAAKLVVALDTATTYLQAVTPSQATEGMEVNVSIWVYCKTASRVSARISGTNVVSTPVDGTAHGGTGWELLTVAANLNSAATTFNAGLSISTGAAIALYADEALCTIGPTEALDREWDILKDWRWVPPVAGASDGGLLEFGYQLPAKRRLRVLGLDLLSSVSADSDTVEIDGPALRLMYDRTRYLVALELAAAPGSEQDRWLKRAEEFETRVKAALDAGVGAYQPKPQWKIPDWSWN